VNQKDCALAIQRREHKKSSRLASRATPGRGYFPAAREVNFGQPAGKILSDFFRSRLFLAHFFPFKRIFTILEAEHPGRQSEGNFNRGFSTKTYPAIYLPNIIPA
jgi:hypothetical protein